MLTRYLQAHGSWALICAIGLFSTLLSSCGDGDSTAGIDGSGSPVPPIAYNDTTIVAQGAINGFGSIIVHGYRYDTSGANFFRNSTQLTEDDFEVGDVVRVLGYSEQGKLYAKEVYFEAVIQGRVEKYDVESGRIIMLDQSVKLDADTVINIALDDGELVGKKVTITGWKDKDHIVATSLSESDNPKKSIVRGTLTRNHHDNKRVYIGDLLIKYYDLENDDFIEDGQNIEFEGELVEPDGHELRDLIDDTGERRFLRAWSARPVDLVLTDEEGLVGAAVVTGIVRDNVDQVGFSIDGVQIALNEETELLNTDGVTLRDGQLVVVRGAPLNDNLIEAESIAVVNLEQKVSFKGEIAVVGLSNGTTSSITISGQQINLSAVTAITDIRQFNSRLTANDLQAGDYVVVTAITEGGRLNALTVKRTSVGLNDRTFGNEAPGKSDWGFPLGEPSNPAGKNLLYSGRLHIVSGNFLTIGDLQGARTVVNVKDDEGNYTRIFDENGESDYQTTLNFTYEMHKLIADGHLVWINVQGEDLGPLGVSADKIYFEVDQGEGREIQGIPIPL